MPRLRTRALGLLIIAALTATAVGGFATASMAQEGRETQVFLLEPFDSIELRGAGRVVIEIGPEPQIEITTATAISGLFSADVEDGELKAGFAASVAFDILTSGGIEYRITAPTLSALELIGPFNATIDGLATDELELDLTRAATITITNLEVTSLEADLDFASEATLSGSATEQEIDVANASTYDAAELETSRTTAEISNASNAVVRVTDALSGSVRTASSLDYLTETATINVDVEFASSLNARPFVPLTPATPEPAATASSSTTSFNVTIAQFSFTSADLEIAVGDTVTWTNDDNFPHDVTQLPKGSGFASPQLAKGQSFSMTFDTPGIYDYYCALHPIMLGTIVVSE